MKKLKLNLSGIFILFIISSNSFCQEQDSLIEIYPGIGDTIDIFDREYFRLFPTINGFEKAVFFIRNNKYFVSKISYSSEGITNDTISVQKLSILERLRSRLEKIEKENDAKLNSPREVIIVKNNGKKYNGLLEMFSKEYLYILKEGYGISKRYKIKLSDVSSITILDDSSMLTSIGWGTGIGFIIGAGIGLAGGGSSSGTVKFNTIDGALLTGGILGLVGGLIGLIGGILSSTDDEFIQYKSQEDLIKLKDYVKYYFSYDNETDIRYSEIQ